MPSIVLQGGPGGFGTVIALITLVVTIALAVWTYRDAQDNSSHSAVLWAVAVFLAPLLGLVLYVILGRNRK